MRFYKLLIGGKIFSQLDSDNPSAIQILFQLQATTQVEIPNAIIELCTLSSDYFLESNDWVGKEVELHAGIKSTPLLKKAGIEPPNQTLILKGYIHQIIPNPRKRGPNNSITLIINPSQPKSASVVTSTTSENQDIGTLLSIKTGDDYKSKFKDALSQLLPQSKVTTHGQPVIAGYNENIILKGVRDLQKRALQSNIQIFVTSEGYAIVDRGKLPPDLSQVTLKLPDFIEQPNLIAVSKINITSYLRADIKPNTLLVIPPNLFFNNTLGLKALGTKPSLFLTGQWRAVNVWHIGDSRGADGSAWQTSIEAVKIKK